MFINDSMNQPLRYIASNGDIIGQFYNSWDKKYHLAKYRLHSSIPYNQYLCGDTGNFSCSRSEHQRNKCEECWNILNEAHNDIL